MGNDEVRLAKQKIGQSPPPDFRKVVTPHIRIPLSDSRGMVSRHLAPPLDHHLQVPGLDFEAVSGCADDVDQVVEARHSTLGQVMLGLVQDPSKLLIDFPVGPSLEGGLSAKSSFILATASSPEAAMMRWPLLGPEGALRTALPLPPITRTDAY